MLIRDSWRAREEQEPSALEREGRARLAAFDRGHADSAAWLRAGESRTLALGLPLASEDAVVRLSADLPEAPGELLSWNAEGFVLVRGRVLQLQVYMPPGAAPARAMRRGGAARSGASESRPFAPNRDDGVPRGTKADHLGRETVRRANLTGDL